MQLEWFRTHKNFVYWILLPVVGITMAFFGVGSMRGSSFSFGKAMPSVSYTVGTNTRVIGPQETLTLRSMLTQYRDPEEGWRGGGQVDSHSAGAHMVKYYEALDSGFEVGKDELKEDLIQSIKSQIQRRDQGAAELSDNQAIELYPKLLDNIKLSTAQFERLTHEYSVRGKYIRFVVEHPIADGEVFAEFCHDKEVVRLRYKELLSSDYVSKAAAPTAEKITEFYNKNKDNPGEKELLFSKPKMSADFLFYDPKKLMADLKPTDEELKDYFERNKRTYWQKQRAATDPVPAPGKEEFKPYDEVKDDVKVKWLEFAKRTRPGDEMRKLYEELTKAEKEWNDNEAKKPDVATRKAFDMDDWATKHNLKHWTTDELTEEQYHKSKVDNEKTPEKQIGAKDSGWVDGLFFWARDPEDPRMNQPQIKEMFKKHFEDWSSEDIDPMNKEKGLIAYRKKNYTKDRLMTLDEAKPAIENRLKIDDAKDLAKKDAEKVEADWKEGKNLPPIDSLEEIKSDSEGAAKAGPIAQKFFETPKAVGDVLIATGPAEERKPGARGPLNPHEKYYIGIVVDRQLPTSTTFEQDTKWDRNPKRRELAGSYVNYVYELLRNNSWSQARVFPANVQDPNLWEELRRSGDN